MKDNMLNYYTEVHKVNYLLLAGNLPTDIPGLSIMTEEEVQLTITTIQQYEKAHPAWDTWPIDNMLVRLLDHRYGWLVADLLAIVTFPVIFTAMFTFAFIHLLELSRTGPTIAPIYAKSIYLDDFAETLETKHFEKNNG